MGKKKKGLADNGDGEFILNESGTSVSTDHGPLDEADRDDKDSERSPQGINDKNENSSSRLR